MKVLIVKQKNTFGIATKNSLQHVHGCSPSLQSQNCHKRQLREKKLMRPSSIWDRSAPSLTGPQRGRTEETPTPPKKHPRWPCRASDGFWLFTHRQLWKMKQWKTITRAQRKSRHPAPIAYPLVRRQFTSSLIDRQWRPNRQGTCLTKQSTRPARLDLQSSVDDTPKLRAWPAWHDAACRNGNSGAPGWPVRA